MPDASHGGHLEPVHTAMPDAHALRIERLGDHDKLLGPLRDPPRGAQPAHAREPPVFLARRGVLLAPPRQWLPRPSDRLDGEDRRRDAALLIARAASVNTSIA